MDSRTGFRFGRPTAWWLAVAVAVGAVGWVKSINVLLFLGFALLGLLPFQARAARRMARGVKAEAGPAPAAHAGRPVAVAFAVVNGADFPATFRVTGPRKQAWAASQLSPGAKVRCAFEATFATRGRHPAGGLAVASGYPFGIFEYRRPLADGPSVVVLPPLGRVRERPFRQWLRHAGRGEGRRSRPVAGQVLNEGEVKGIRPYRTGDNPRDVHWKTTARRGQLFVREYDAADPPALAIVVEPFAPAGTVGRYEPLEAALSLAATIATTWREADESGAVTVFVLGAGPAAPGEHDLAPLADAQGSPDPGGDPVRFLRAARNGHRLFVSGRPGSPWPQRLATAGVSVISLDATRPPLWYDPPAQT